MMKVRRRVAAVIATAALLASTIGALGAANAATWNLNGTITDRSNGIFTYYNTYRYHAVYGDVKLTITSRVSTNGYYTMQSQQGNFLPVWKDSQYPDRTWSMVKVGSYAMAAAMDPCTLLSKALGTCNSNWSATLTM